MDELEAVRSFRRSEASPNSLARAAARERLIAHMADDDLDDQLPCRTPRHPMTTVSTASRGKHLRSRIAPQSGHRTKERLHRSLPGRVEIFALNRKVRRLAMREAASPDTLVDSSVPSFQRLLITTLDDSWLPSLAAVAGQSFRAINRDLENGDRERERLLERLPVARENAKHVPKFKLDLTTQLAIVLAWVLGLTATWPFIQTLGWPAPISAVLCFALGAFQVAIAVFFGVSVHALVMDEPKTPFCLTVKQHYLFRACAVLTGTLAFASVVMLAALRGYGNNDQIVWLILGLGLVAFSAYAGAAFNDSRFDEAVKRLEKDLQATEDRIVTLQNAFLATARATMATGRGLCGAAARSAERGAAAFAKSYRRCRRAHGIVVPTLTQLSVPSDADLRMRLLVDMYAITRTSDEHSYDGFDYDGDDKVAPAEPQQLGVRSDAEVRTRLLIDMYAVTRASDDNAYERFDGRGTDEVVLGAEPVATATRLTPHRHSARVEAEDIASESWAGSGTAIHRREHDQQRVLYADARLAAQLRQLGAPTVPSGHSGPWVLHESLHAAARAVYAADDREAFDETVEVYPVEVVPAWGEIEIPRRADQAREEALSMMRPHGRDWEISALMADLLMTLEGSIVAISVPVGDARLIWLPMLTLLEGMVTVGSPQRVRMRRPAAREMTAAGGRDDGSLYVGVEPDP